MLLLRKRGLRHYVFLSLFVLFVFIFIVVSRNQLRAQYVLTNFKMRDTGHLLRLPEPRESEIFDNPTIQQDDERLLAYIRRHHVLPPPSHPIEPELCRRAYGYPSHFRKELAKIFGRKTGGLFIEAGANDGVFLSNTLELERDFGWTGLLIEPQMFVYANLRKLRRNAWISNACIALDSQPSKANISHIVGRKFNPDRRGAAYIAQMFTGYEKFKANMTAEQGTISGGRASCFPLYSLLLAIGMTEVDYFSLDVQGIELKILKTVPWDRVTINVITVEHNCIPEGKEELRKLLTNNGYHVYLESESDFIFLHNKFLA